MLQITGFFPHWCFPQLSLNINSVSQDPERTLALKRKADTKVIL